MALESGDRAPAFTLTDQNGDKVKLTDDKFSLGFPLLSDPDHQVADKYGAWGEKSMYGKKYQGIIRSSFLIGENGKIMEAWPKISPKDTPKKLLKALQDRVAP